MRLYVTAGEGTVEVKGPVLLTGFVLAAGTDDASIVVKDGEGALVVPVCTVDYDTGHYVLTATGLHESCDGLSVVVTGTNASAVVYYSKATVDASVN